MPEKTLEQRVKKLENYFWIAFTLAGFFGISGAYLAKLVYDAHVKASEAVQLATQAEQRLADATQQAIAATEKAASVAVAKEAERQVVSAMDNNINTAMNKVRSEIPNAVLVTESAWTDYGSNSKRLCSSGVASGVAFGTLHSDVAAYCSSLSLGRKQVP